MLLHTAEALVDPDQVLGLTLNPAGRQVRGQRSQRTAGPGRKRSLHAIIQLSRGEAAFTRRRSQRLDSPVPVRVRHSQLWLRSPISRTAF